MKKYIYLIGLILAVAYNSTATIRTLCNMPYSPGQFNNFTAAITACVNNDTIYVHGSTTSYGAITINKTGIVVIGTGHNPVKQSPLVSAFTTITINSQSCQLIGLTFDNMISFSNFTSVKRCKILQPNSGTAGILATGTSLNWIIEGSVFISSTGTNVLLNSSDNSNTTVRNNIFNGIISANGTLTTLTTFIIANNNFLGPNFLTVQVSNATINNNIFYRSAPQGTFIGCAMNNNISFQCTNNNFSAPGSNNLVNVNPLFVSFPLAGALFDYSHNYALAAGSPGILSGSDGTDRGVFGGFGGKFNMTGEPGIAEITTFSITSPTSIPPGGTLNINVSSKRVR
jgi:hypothetical protein